MKSLFNTFMIAIAALAVASCVPKATENKAVCGKNQAFDTVSRSCYSIEETRRVPVGTASSASTSEETPKTITLTYTDANKDQAKTCAVSGISVSSIEVVSPWITDGGIYTTGDLVFQAANNLATAIPAGAQTASANAAKTAMLTAYSKAKSSLSTSTISSQLLIVQAQIGLILGYATFYPADATVQSYYTLTQQRLIPFNAMLLEVSNKCACSGGVCTTTVIPKLGQNGAAGFSYTITDADGPSLAKAVSVTITPTALTAPHLRPAAESSYISTFVESDTSLAPATPYTFTMPLSNDLSGTATSAFKYYFNGAKNGSNQGITTKGIVYNCMDLAGSTQLTTGVQDRTCTFVPTSYDTSSVPGAVKATGVAGGLTFTAISEGVSGNNYSIAFYDLSLTTTTSVDAYATQKEKFGLVDPTSEAYIRVVGNVIEVFINPNVTTSAQVAAMITSHLQAKHLVTVTAGAAVAYASVPAGVTLSTGTDDYDTIPYYTSNGTGISTNSANVLISMAVTNDKPMVPRTYSGSVFSQTETFTEETLKTITLKLADVDNVAGFSVSAKIDTTISSCATDGVVSSESAVQTYFNSLVTSTNFVIAAPGAITLDSGNIYKFNMDVTPQLDFTGNACLYYQITDLSSAVSYIQGVHIVVNPINDAPLLSSTNTLPIVTLLALTTTSINEDLSPATQSYTDVYVGPGGGTFEASQTLTITASSDNPALIPNVVCPVTGALTGSGAPISIETADRFYVDTTNYRCYKFTSTAVNTAANWKLYPSLTVFKTSASNYKIAYVPVANQSSPTPVNITVTVKDNGLTAVAGDIDTVTGTFAVTVNFVDDPPVFRSTIISVDTNEGGAVQSGAFQVDEDDAGTVDENTQAISITALTSDNQSVLPDSSIKIFYDLNDNGVEDTGEKRCVTSDVSCTVAQRTSLEPSGTPGMDVSLHKFYLKLDPVDGVSGNANVTMTISDGTTSVPTNFSFIVHPVAALHGGWTNISSVGLKTDKTGAPVTAADMVCGYNLSTDKNNCGATNCTGSSSPNGLITPNSANTIYWDSSNLRCYRSTGTTMFTWVDHNTSCPVTTLRLTPTTLTTALTAATATITVASTSGFPSTGVIKIDSEQIAYTSITSTTFAGITRGSNGTTAATHAAATSVAYRDNGVPFIRKVAGDYSQAITAPNQYLFTSDDQTCHRSYYDVTGTLVWDAANYQPAKVTLSWKPFIMVGSGSDSSVQINGWNVYRREAGTSYNFIGGHLKNASSTSVYTITDPTLRTFTDTTAVAGKSYFYVVRPVDSIRKLPTYTPELFSEVRVIASPPNYSFVHRWMVNQEMCNGMNITSTTTPHHVDQTENFRCEYSGPGSVNISGTDYYDYGKDLLVDTQEAGCPYAAAPACSANGCIGIGAPAVAASNNDLYYDRSAGKCYVYNGGWSELQLSGALNTTQVNKTNTALNAPLTNITNARASAVCAMRDAPTLSFATIATKAILPTKKDYMAYSSQKLNVTDAEVTEMEQGFSLNIQSRCNGSAASGLDTAFTDSAIPSTSFIYSLPGTYSSGIRSLYTGSIPWGSSKGTDACVSRFGIQDLYGNVAEWVNDGMTCDADVSSVNAIPYNTKFCTAKTASGTFKVGGDYGSAKYAFNNLIGPYAEGGDGILSYNTTMTGGLITSGTMTITVTSTVNFPNPGTLFIDNEQITYTIFDGTTFTVTARGVNGTTAAGHIAGSIVRASNDDSWLTNWTFADELFGAGNFNYVLGLPVTENIDHTTYSAYMDWILAIGPSNGITVSKLHEDGMIVNGSPGAKSFAVGGSYLSGNRAGRFSSELISDTASRSDVGFRCAVPINTADTANGGDYPADANYVYPN